MPAEYFHYVEGALQFILQKEIRENEMEKMKNKLV